MAFMVNLKEVYIDPADVEAYMTETAESGKVKKITTRTTL